MSNESQSGTNVVRGEELRGFIERIERLQSQKTELSDGEKQVYAEAKAIGYTSRYMKAIIKLRKKSPSERDEDDAMMDMYLAAVGMARETPLFRHVQGMGVDVAAAEKVMEALKLLAPEDGEITIKVGSAPRMRLWRDKGGVQVEEVKDAPPPPAPSMPANEPSANSGVNRPGAQAPDCTIEESYALGRQARLDDLAIIKNPFAWDDKRRPKWDQGWRDEDGGDGMGPE